MAMSRRPGCSSFTTRSPIAISPDVGFSSPATIRRAVVLPHPDGPTKTMNSPSAIASDRSSTATTSPNRFVTERNSTVATSL